MMRNKFMPNEIILHIEYAELIIYDKNCKEKARALIDLEDVEKVKKYKWCENGQGYIISSKNKQHPKYYLHRFVLNYLKENFVDHINHNKLDNRKSNLRIVTPQQNMMNRKTIKPTDSGVVGVNYINRTNKWRSVIMVNNKTIFLGYYDKLDDAIKIRKQAEIKYFGEYRNKD